MAIESNIDRSAEAFLDPHCVPPLVATEMNGMTLRGFRMSVFATVTESFFVRFAEIHPLFVRGSG